MKALKWFLFGILTAGIGFLIYKFIKRDSDVKIDGFVDGFMGFSATPSPIALKKYGEIAQEVQQKQIKAHKAINAAHKEQRVKLKMQ